MFEIFNFSLYWVFVIFKYQFQLLSLAYMAWYCKNVQFMSALCSSLLTLRVGYQWLFVVVFFLRDFSFFTLQIN